MELQLKIRSENNNFECFCIKNFGREIS